MPLFLESEGPFTTVFDTTDFVVPDSVSQPGSGGEVFTLTLFVWPLEGEGSAPVLPSLDIELVTEGVSAKLLGLPADAMTLLFSSSIVQGESFKVLERLVLRGDQQVRVAVGEAAGGGGNMAVYGYFERGEEPLPFGLRPLEPGPLVPPFSAAPGTITVPALTLEQTPAHHLEVNGDYWDYVTMFVNARVNVIEGSNDGHSSVILPNGMNLFIPASAVDAQVAPFPSAGNNLIQIGVTDEVPAGAAGATTMVSTGRFVRGT